MNRVKRFWNGYDNRNVVISAWRAPVTYSFLIPNRWNLDRAHARKRVASRRTTFGMTLQNSCCMRNPPTYIVNRVPLKVVRTRAVIQYSKCLKLRSRLHGHRIQYPKRKTPFESGVVMSRVFLFWWIDWLSNSKRQQNCLSVSLVKMWQRQQFHWACIFNC